MWTAFSRYRSFWAFLTVVILGVVLVASLALTKQPIFIFSATMLLMLSYGIWLYFEARTTGDVERCADNIYYLGFSLTLIALIVAMVFLHKSPSPAGLKDVLYQFGLGLCTTFFGLIGRIMLLQLDRASGDIREAVDRHIEEAASQLAAQLDIGIRYLSAAQTQMEETITKHTQHCGDALTSTTGVITAQSRQLGEELNALVGEIRNLRILYTGELKKSSKSMTSGIESALQTTSAALSESTRVFHATLERIFTDLESRMTKVRFPAEVWERQIREASEGIQSQFKQVESVIETLREALKSQADSTREVAEATKQHYSVFNEANRQLSEQSNLIARELERIRSLRQQIHAEVESSVQDTKKVQQALVDGARYITKELEGDGK